MPQWGANTSNTTSPTWSYLTEDGSLKLPNSAFATSEGWVVRHRGASGRKKDEVVVGIGGLATQLGIPRTRLIEVVNTPLTNVNPSNVAFRVCFNQPVTVSGVPTLVAIASGNGVANVTLVYNASLSDPTSGRLVFANGTANFALGVNSLSSMTVNSTLGISQNSTVNVTASIGTAGVNANGTPQSSANVAVVAA